jgi:hypothetical protein
MNDSRSRIGSFISGIKVEIVKTVEVFAGAEGEFARSDPLEVAIGAMVVSGIMSMGRASCWLTFWLTPPSFGLEAAGSGFLTVAVVCRPFTFLRGPADWTVRVGGVRPGRDGSFGIIRMSSSPIGTRRPGDDGALFAEPQRKVGSPDLPPEEVLPWLGWRGTNPFDSRLNRAVTAQIAKKMSGTSIRVIS